MAGHAVPSPLSLTHPAPVEATPRLAAAPVPLCRRPEAVLSQLVKLDGKINIFRFENVSNTEYNKFVYSVFSLKSYNS